MTKALRRRHDPAAPDDGAAAVEFALLLPIFVILAVGMMSAGILFFNNLTITQASRDAARLGTTLPITTVSPAPTTGEIPIGTWLQQVHDLAKTQAWGSTTADITTEANGVGYICVAYVRKLSGTGMDTTSMYSGVPRGYNTSSTDKCFEDSRDDNRVQVLVRRDGELNGVFIYKKWELVAKGDIPYERQAP